MTKVMKKWINLCNKWINLLWLKDHEVRYKFLGEKSSSDTGNWAGVAEVEIQPRYRTALISAYKDVLNELSDGGMEDSACHEVVHILLAPLNEFVTEILDELPKSKRDGWDAYRDFVNERVTQHVTDVVCSLYRSPRGR